MVTERKWFVSVCRRNHHLNFPVVNPPALTPLVRNSQTFNTSAMNPPTFHYPPLTRPPFNPSIMNSPILTYPVLHQPTFNPPGFIQEVVNPPPTAGQPMQPQYMNLPNLNHQLVLEFTFVMEYMGERIVIHTDQPISFQIFSSTMLLRLHCITSIPHVTTSSGQLWHLDGWVESSRCIAMRC